jgi:hypothetical protein
MECAVWIDVARYTVSTVSCPLSDVCLVLCLCRSPGYGITLVSESTAGVLHSAELFSHSPPSQGVEKGARQPQPPALPEDIGKQTALLLIQEIVKVRY